MSLQSLNQKLDEIRGLLVNGPQGQDSAEFGHSETAGDQYMPAGWDDDDEVVDDEMANEVGRLREELRRARESEEALRQERDFFIKRSNEQGARLSQAKDQRDELQRWVNQLQAERYQMPHEDLVTITTDELDDLRKAKKERDQESVRADKAEESLRLTAQRAKEAEEALDKAERERDQAREEIVSLRDKRDQYKRELDQMLERNRKLLNAQHQIIQDHEQEKAEIRKERDAERELRGHRRREVEDQTARAEKAEELAEKARDTLHNIHGIIHEELE